MASLNKDGFKDRSLFRTFVEDVCSATNDDTHLNPIKAVLTDKSFLHENGVNLNAEADTIKLQKQFSVETASCKTDFESKTKENRTLDFTLPVKVSNIIIDSVDRYQLEINPAEIMLHNVVKHAEKKPSRYTPEINLTKANIQGRSVIETERFRKESSCQASVTNLSVTNGSECSSEKPVNETRENAQEGLSISKHSVELFSAENHNNKVVISDSSCSNSSHIRCGPIEEDSELCSTSTSTENPFPSTEFNGSSDSYFFDDFVETSCPNVGNGDGEVLLCNGFENARIPRAESSDVNSIRVTVNKDCGMLSDNSGECSEKVSKEKFDVRNDENGTGHKIKKSVKNEDVVIKLDVVLNGEISVGCLDPSDEVVTVVNGCYNVSKEIVVCEESKLKEVNNTLVKDVSEKYGSVNTEEIAENTEGDSKEINGNSSKAVRSLDVENSAVSEESLKSEYGKKVGDSFENMSGNNNDQNNLETIDEDENPNLARMKYLECPFTWKPDTLCNVYRSKNDIVSSLLEREKDYLRAERDIFREFVVYLILAYERCSSDEASDDLQKCCELISLFVEKEKKDGRELILAERSDDNEEEIWRNDKKIEERADALRYILAGSTLFILKQKYDRKEFEVMPPVEIQEFGPIGRATILAVKAAVLAEYGYEGNYRSFQFFKEAAYMDNDYWQWKLYYGKAIERRLRLSFYGKEDVFFKLSTEQIENLQIASNLKPNHPSLLIHLGNAYRHYASQMYRMWRIINNSEVAVKKPMTPEEQEKLKPFKVFDSADTFETCQMNLFKKACECFEKAFRLEKYSPNVISRCAHAMGSLPYPYKNAELAGEGHKRSLCMAPDNSMVNHYAGLFYERMGNFKMALELYERATDSNKLNYTAEMSAINLRLCRSDDEMYSPTIRLHHLLRKYPERTTRIQTYTHMGFYYYRIEKQLTLALRCFYEALKLDPKSQFLRNFVPWKFYDTKDVSYNTVSLLQEIIRCLRNANCSIPLQKYLDSIVQFFIDNNIKP